MTSLSSITGLVRKRSHRSSTSAAGRGLVGGLELEADRLADAYARDPVEAEVRQRPLDGGALRVGDARRAGGPRPGRRSAWAHGRTSPTRAPDRRQAPAPGQAARAVAGDALVGLDVARGWWRRPPRRAAAAAAASCPSRGRRGSRGPAACRTTAAWHPAPTRRPARTGRSRASAPRRPAPARRRPGRARTWCRR